MISFVRGKAKTHLSCSVWCGVVWCGVVWCGVVWCGVVWCGVVWCGMVWCCFICCRNYGFLFTSESHSKKRSSFTLICKLCRRKPLPHRIRVFKNSNKKFALRPSITDGHSHELTDVMRQAIPPEWIAAAGEQSMGEFLQSQLNMWISSPTLTDSDIYRLVMHMSYSRLVHSKRKGGSQGAK
jgi:hypothetical protein